ncbi:MAG: hypothetical protein TREMPRED_000861 [Tremellales sp. Tagirdzhanova-0007]|nr:MAG: hypothetical protein TREMPRED_000861 [Tremellales sp. Tagirdzhanova-0007]
MHHSPISREGAFHSSSADSSVGASTDISRSNATVLTDASVTLRLNKRESQAIWHFEICGKSQSGKEMIISHQVVVHVLSQRRQQELNEPLCPPPDIHLVLPNLGELRNVVSRLSHLADDLTMSANLEGTMELAVKDKTGRVNLTTTWKDLHIPQSTTDQDGDGEPPAKDKMFSTLVSIRGLLKFLTSHIVGGVAIACICENHCVIAYVYIGEINEAGGVLTFFIPAKNTGDF